MGCHSRTPGPQASAQPTAPRLAFWSRRALTCGVRPCAGGQREVWCVTPACVDSSARATQGFEPRTPKSEGQGPDRVLPHATGGEKFWVF